MLLLMLIITIIIMSMLVMIELVLPMWRLRHVKRWDLQAREIAG